MPKSLMAGLHGQTLATGEEWLIGSRFNGTTEAQSQYQATEAATFSGMRGVIASGGSGTNTFRFRNNGANGNQVQAVAGAVTFEDATNSDTVAAGNVFNGGYTDDGTDSVLRTVAFNVEFASGHGNFHAASGVANTVMDVASSTRYLPIQGNVTADGASAGNLGNAQFRVREYTSIEAFQIRVNANARLNDSVFSVNVNGTDVGTAITFATTVTGLQVVTGMGIALSPGDLVCISMTLGTGVEDLNFGFCGVTMKSTANSSAAGYGNIANTNILDTTASYFSFGTGVTTTESAAAVKVGFAARCKCLRCYLSDNTGTEAGTLKLFVNGSAVITKAIGVGETGWIENLTDSYDITDTDTVSFEIVGNGVGFVATVHQVWISFEEIPAAAPAAVQATLTYGAGTFPKDYEARVRAHYERQEEFERKKLIAEQEQRARDERLRELQRQQAELDERKKTEARKSAIAKRKAKLAREIAEIEKATAAANAEIAALMEQIQAFIDEQMLLDRRRRMVLLLAGAA